MALLVDRDKPTEVSSTSIKQLAPRKGLYKHWVEPLHLVVQDESSDGGVRAKKSRVLSD